MNTSIRDVGIILRRRPFSEADLLLTVFTREHGKITILTKGSRKIKSKFMGHFEPFCLVKFTCIYGKSFLIMTALETLDSHFMNKESSASIKIFSYISEVVDALTPEGEENRKLFLKIKKYLETKDITEISIVTFLFDILETSGFAPNLLNCSSCGEEKNILNHFSFYWGGLVCPSCSSGSSSKKIKSDTINYLREKIQGKIAKTQETKEIKEILKSFVEYINENKIKTSKYV